MMELKVCATVPSLPPWLVLLYSPYFLSFWPAACPPFPRKPVSCGRHWWQRSASPRKSGRNDARRVYVLGWGSKRRVEAQKDLAGDRWGSLQVGAKGSGTRESSGDHEQWQESHRVLDWDPLLPHCGASGRWLSCLLFHLSDENSGAGEMAQQSGVLAAPSQSSNPSTHITKQACGKTPVTSVLRGLMPSLATVLQSMSTHSCMYAHT